MKKENKIAVTDYIPNEQYFVLPFESWPSLRLEIFNKKLNQWRIAEFDIFIRPRGKKKKTDKQIKIYYPSTL